MVRVNGVGSFKKMRLNWLIERRIRTAAFMWYVKRHTQYYVKEVYAETVRHFEKELTSALAEYY